MMRTKCLRSRSILHQSYLEILPLTNGFLHRPRSNPPNISDAPATNDLFIPSRTICILICAPPLQLCSFRHDHYPSLEKVWGYLGISNN